MSGAGWAAFLVAAAALAGYAAWSYRRRELPIRGRGLLAVLRGATLVLVLLLLWNPSVPGTPLSAGPRAWLLVDASSSMAAGPEGATPWDSARAVARNLGGDARVALFGAEVTPLDPGDLPSRPEETHSRLAPALEQAAEAGARAVTVVSDLRVDDPVEVEAAVDRLGLDVRWVDVGSDVRDAGVEAVEGPRAVGPGEGPTLTVVVFASGAAPGDSVRVEVGEEGRPPVARTVAAPSPGRRARVRFDLPHPRGEGEVRYQARVALPGDAVPADDQAPAWVNVSPGEGRVILVSMAADWEPRFLLPVLAGVSGLPARGYLRVGPDRFLPFQEEGAAQDRAGGSGGAASAADVARAASAAELLVVQGVGADVPAWLRDGASGASRLLVLPGDPAGASLAGLAPGRPRGGEWYVAQDLPASPVAAELSGVSLGGLPPLGPVFPLVPGPGVVPVLRLQLGGAGETAPGLVLSTTGGRRVATALAQGFWRWAFRPGDARDVYRRLWSGVTGWLLAAPATRAAGVAPLRQVAPAGEPLAWSARGAAGGTLRLAIERGDSAVLDTTVAVPESALFRTPALPPGTYAWRARSGSDTTGGRFDVAAPAAEFAQPRMRPPVAAAAGGRDGPGGARATAPPHPPPSLRPRAGAPGRRMDPAPAAGPPLTSHRGGAVDPSAGRS